MRKTTRSSTVAPREQDLLREYDFDYSTAKPNRFAGRMPEECIAIVLEPDVASVFDNPEAVNTLLRSVIAALPHQRLVTGRGRGGRKSTLKPTPQPRRPDR